MGFDIHILIFISRFILTLTQKAKNHQSCIELSAIAMICLKFLLFVCYFYIYDGFIQQYHHQFSKSQYQSYLNSVKSTITVNESSKKRIDVYLSELLSDHSRSYYGNLCEKGKVKVNSKVKDKAYKVSRGDIIEYEIEEKIDDEKVAPENIPLDILYEDDDILAINKPVGMVVHPAVGSPNGI